jgi:hypothetical protein
MEYGILLIIAFSLGAGVAGGLLAAWSCHRRMLVIEETLKVVLPAMDDRIAQATKIATREQKTEAANIRWSKAKRQDESLAEQLTKTGPGQTDLALIGHPWDPRTWGSK